METGDSANSGGSDQPETGLRWYQYTLRSLFVLMGITAVFFSVARTIGYVDAVVSLAAFGVLVGTMRYPRRVHLTTGVILVLIAGTLLWANLRPTRWQGEFGGVAAPAELDPITKAVFWRGWPLSPCMLSLIHGVKFHSSGVQWALAVDGILFVVVLIAAKAICERWSSTARR
jgi:hypothetical protein